jgi:outer membrane biosynthesis protein TonB
MRKLIMIATMVLVSATAQAGVSRGLTLASNDEPAAATTQPATAETPTASDIKAPETPAYVARPAPVNTATPAPQPDQAKTQATAPEPAPVTARADKPKRRHESTEARVINELHRHGIYW